MYGKLKELFWRNTELNGKLFKHTLILRLCLALMTIYFLVLSVLTVIAGSAQGLHFGMVGFVAMGIMLAGTYQGWTSIVGDLFCLSLSAIALVISLLYGCSASAIVFMFVQILVLFTVNLMETRKRMSFIVLLAAYYIFLFNYVQKIQPFDQLNAVHLHAIQILHYTVGGFLVLAIVSIFTVDSEVWERDLLEKNECLRTMAEFDALTKISNRASISEYLNRSMMKYQSDRMQALTVAIADIDFFKRVNDTYGHNCGDVVLQEIAFLMRDFMAGKGNVGRWGGEEFLFVFDNMNGEQVTSALYELQRSIRRLEMNYENNSFFVTMTFGVAEFDPSGDATLTISEADRKLYIGKQSGRNAVIF